MYVISFLTNINKLVSQAIIYISLRNTALYAERYLRTDALTVSRSVMHQRYYQLDDIKQVDHAEQKLAVAGGIVWVRD